jgi:predicted SAM-dependent methyltransferase
MEVRVHVGCGNKILDGYLNCDFGDNYSGQEPDVCCDIRQLPFDNNFADEVLAVHVLEHFYIWEAEEVLCEWMRVLKPGGRLVIEVPCLDKIINHFIRFDGKPPMNLGMWGLYGDPGYNDERMCHRWAYSVSMLKALMETVGLFHVEQKKPEYHVAIRDMRMIGYKEC